MDDLRFSLIGDDRLSPAMTHAGDSALAMAGRVQLAATDADLALAGLSRDVRGRVRDAQEGIIPEAAALGRAIGGHIRGGMDSALASLHPVIEVTADDSPADRRVHLLAQRIQALGSAQIGVDVDPADAIAQLDAIRADAEQLARSHPDVVVQAHIAQALRGIDAMRGDVERLDGARAAITVDVDADRARAETEDLREDVRRLGDDDGPDRAGRRFGVLGSVIGRVGSVLGGLAGRAAPLAAIGAGAGAAAPLAAGLVTTLLGIAPAAAVAVTGIVAVVTATQTLKLATHGVGTAISDAFDPKKTKQYREDLKGLVPAAQQFVQAIAGVKGPLHTLQQQVQQKVFSGLGSDFKDLARSAMPPVRSALLSTAGSFNAMGRGVIQTATDLADTGVLGRALHGATKGLGNLVDLPGKIVNALGEIGAAAAPQVEKLTAAADKSFGGVLDKIDRAFESGKLSSSISNAVGLIRQIGGTIRNVGTIISNVFRAAGASGGAALGPLGQIIGILAQLSGETAFQQVLGGLFGIMADLAKTALPLLSSALKVISPVITALSSPVLMLIDALGDGLRPIITALGPVLLAAAGAVGQLLDAVDPLLPVVGQMIASLGPVLTPILTIIGGAFADLAPVLAQLGRSLLPPLVKITSTLVGAFADLAPVLMPALAQLGDQGLTPIITGLSDVISDLVTQYADQFIGLFEQLLPVIPELIPVVLQLATSIGQILEAVAPLLPQIMTLSTQLLTALLPAILPLVPVLAQMEIAFLKLATGAITGVVIPVLSGLIDFVGGVGRKLHPLVSAAETVTRGVEAAFRWLYDVLLGHSIIPDIVNGTIGWFAGLPGRAASALAGLAGAVAGKARDAGDRLIGSIRTGISHAVDWVRGLPGRAADALGDLSGTLYRSGRSLIGGFIDGITSMAGDAASAASSVLGKVKGYFPNSPAKEGPFSGRGWTWYSGVAVMDDWSGGMRSRTSTVTAAVGAVTGAAAAGFPGRSTLPGLGAAPGLAAGPGAARAVTIPITVQGALDPVAVARQIQQVLLTLRRLTGVDLDLGTAGGTA